MSGLFKELCDNLVRLPNVVSAGTYHIYVGGWVLNEVGEIVLQKLLHHPWSTPCVNGKDKSNTRIGGGLYVLFGNRNERVIRECGKVLCDIATIARS